MRSVTAKDIVLAVAIPLILAEVGPWCGWVAVRLLAWAAKLRYGNTDKAAIRVEEWSGDLGEIPGQLTKLAYSLGQFIAGSAKFVQGKMHGSVPQALNLPDLVKAEPMVTFESREGRRSSDTFEHQHDRESDQVQRARDLGQYRVICAWEDCIAPLSAHVAYLTGMPNEEDPADVAAGLAFAAIGYRTLGLFTEALPLFEQALQITETTLDPDDQLLSTRLRNLANCYRELGLAEKAGPLEQRLRQIAMTSGASEAGHTNLRQARGSQGGNLPT